MHIALSIFYIFINLSTECILLFAEEGTIENFSISAIWFTDKASCGSGNYQAEVVKSSLSFQVDMLVMSQRLHDEKTTRTRGNTIAQTLVPLMESLFWLGNIYNISSPLSFLVIILHTYIDFDICTYSRLCSSQRRI